MDELNEFSWGVHFNEKSFGYSDLEAPDWVKDCENKFSWFSEGLVVWDENQKVVVNLSMWGAMNVLDQMLNSSLWKSQGQDVCQQYGKIALPTPRRGRKKANMPDEANSQDGPKTENVIITLHLGPEQAEKFFGFLKDHERKIRVDGDHQKSRFENGIKELARLVAEYQRKNGQQIPEKE